MAKRTTPAKNAPTTKKAKGVKNEANFGVVAPPGAKAEFTASEAGCLDRASAEGLVFSCTGFGPVDVDTKLGQLFPSAVVRRGFCGCVLVKAKAAGVEIDTVPSPPDSTIEDIIEALTC